MNIMRLLKHSPNNYGNDLCVLYVNVYLDKGRATSILDFKVEHWH